MSKGKKPVFEVASAPQISLFDPSETEPELSQGEVHKRTFRNPDPREIYLGGRRLDKYLKEAGQQEPFVVRDLLHSLDFSEFEANYAPVGRAPYAPAAMLGLILWGIINGVDTLRGLEKLARTDLACMWICGGIAPEFSVIGRFLRRHQKLLAQGEFFAQLTGTVLEQCGSEATELAGDGTVIEAAASRYKALDEQAAAHHAEQVGKQADDDPGDEELQRKKERAEKAARKVRRRAAKRKAKGKDPAKAVVAPSEPDAYIQRLKKAGSAPCYKPSILANADRFIVSQTVHPSSEKAVVESLVEQAQNTCGKPVKRLLLDGNYFAISILSMALHNNIDVLIPEGKFDAEGDDEPVMQGGKFHKSEFVYDTVSDTLKCPAGQRLVPQMRGRPNGTQPAYVQYGGAACDGCRLRPKCTTAKGGRTVKRYEGDQLKDVQRQVMRQPGARKKYRHRQGWVEPVFSELRGVQGLNRFRRRGLQKVKAEFSLHAMAHNIRRLLKVLGVGSRGLLTAVFIHLWKLTDLLWHRWSQCNAKSPTHRFQFSPMAIPICREDRLKFQLATRK